MRMKTYITIAGSTPIVQILRNVIYLDRLIRFGELKRFPMNINSTVT